MGAELASYVYQTSVFWLSPHECGFGQKALARRQQPLGSAVHGLVRILSRCTQKPPFPQRLAPKRRLLSQVVYVSYIFQWVGRDRDLGAAELP